MTRRQVPLIDRAFALVVMALAGAGLVWTAAAGSPLAVFFVAGLGVGARWAMVA